LDIVYIDLQLYRSKYMSQLSLFSPIPPTTWSVTDLTRYLRELLESDELLQDVWIQGEVSNFSRPSSGHLYFTIKDRGAALRCVMWRNTAMRQEYLPRDGEAVEVHGAISVYEVGGQYQLYADQLRPAGEGALYQEFIRLRNRLEAEGMFDSERKREIPRWPRRIGIVTSPTGAALRDMLNTLRRRYPLVEVILAPTPVQGEDAPPAICAALQKINQVALADVILLARGGGSIEDLWAFNDERVARAIVASSVPVITGIGHETDFTIADFVADLRAPTPTAAAELATPNQADLSLVIDDFSERLAHATQAVITTQRWILTGTQNRLAIHTPRTRLDSNRQRTDELAHRLERVIQHILTLQQTNLRGLTQRMDILSPLAGLQRGYAIISDLAGNVVSSTKQVSPGDPLRVSVSDGEFGVRVE
jgi:exodeoxyribonuclease VII large subunit